jgi:Zn-dependent protease with chaperone function
LVAAVRRIRQSTREHAAAALMVGRPAERPNLVVVTAPQATAYCVNGGRRRNTIVVTTAAIDRLDESTLAAVLAHETAHLQQRHHHILTVFNALAVAVPQIPLFAVAPQAVAPLLEMSADDAAARTHGRGPLVTGLISLTAPAGAPEGALAAAGSHVLARVIRLNAAIAPRHRWHERLTLMAAMGLAAVTPALAALYCLY